MAQSDSDKPLEPLDDVFREAMARRQRGDLSGAEACLRQALAGYEELGVVDRQARARINLAQIGQQRGEHAEARAEYERALALAESIEDAARIGLCLGGLATIALERGEHARCETLIERALAVFREREDPVGVGNQLGNLGLLRQQQGRLEEAVRCFSEAAQYFVGAGHAPGAIGVLQCIGELHRRQGEFEDAQTAHAQALDLARQRGNALAAAHSHRALGQIHRHRGELERARHHIARGLELHRRMGDARGELAALIDLGTVEFAQGRGAAAVEHLNACIARARALDLRMPLCKALLNRALYRLDTDRLDEVSADLDEAESLLDELQDPQGWNVWTITRARVDIRRGDWERAGAVLEEELKRVEASNMAPSRPAILGLLGSVALCRGETARALVLFGESEANYRGLGDVEGARMAILSKARLLAEGGKVVQALSSLDALLEALRAEPVPQPILEGEVLVARAGARELQGSYEAALADAREALERFTEAEFQLSQNGAGLFVAQLETTAHRLANRSLPEDHVDTLRRLFARALAFEAPTAEIMGQCALADGLEAHGERAEAVELAGQALARARELSFRDGEARALEVLARAEQDRSKALQACLLWEALECRARAERLAAEWSIDGSERGSA